MKNAEKKIDFDLSKLTLKQLIEVYENIDEFLGYLNDNRIIIEDKENENE